MSGYGVGRSTANCATCVLRTWSTSSMPCGTLWRNSSTSLVCSPLLSWTPASLCVFRKVGRSMPLLDCTWVEVHEIGCGKFLEEVLNVPRQPLQVAFTQDR